MFRCAHPEYGQITHFRRGGIEFALEMPDKKEFVLEDGTKYIVFWNQSPNKAEHVFDIFIKQVEEAPEKKHALKRPFFIQKTNNQCYLLKVFLRVSEVEKDGKRALSVLRERMTNFYVKNY